MNQPRVLVVEDEPLTAMEECVILCSLGCEVGTVAAFGEEAVKLTGESKPDLILMDIKLAGAMDGIEAARLIRQRFDIPIIFVTGCWGKDIFGPHQLDLLDGYGYVSKPFTEAELSCAVKLFLDENLALPEVIDANHRAGVEFPETERGA